MRECSIPIHRLLLTTTARHAAWFGGEPPPTFTGTAGDWGVAFIESERMSGWRFSGFPTTRRLKSFAVVGRNDDGCRCIRLWIFLLHSVSVRLPVANHVCRRESWSGAYFLILCNFKYCHCTTPHTYHHNRQSSSSSSSSLAVVVVAVPGYMLYTCKMCLP